MSFAATDQSAILGCVNAEEIPLVGGNVNDGVVRVGDTVRRTMTPWAATSHALLEHLERVGFEGAPRFLGVDEKGREVLTYMPGEVCWLDGTTPHLATNAGMARIGRLVREFHDASADWVPPAGAAWATGCPDPVGSSRVIHADLAPWNVIAHDEGWSIIDWDAVQLGRIEWELAYTLHSTIWATEPSDAEMVGRVHAFATAYGADDALLRDSLELLPERVASVAAMIDRLADQGHPAFRRMRDEGHDTIWRDAADRATRAMPTWFAMIF